MRQNKNNPIHWIAEENYTFIRKADGFDMGEEIWLGIADSIENYEEKEVEQKNEEPCEQDCGISQ